MLGSSCSGPYAVSRASYQPSPARYRATNMRSVKYRPKPGSSSIAARSVTGRACTSSTTSGTPSMNVREEVRLSASVSVMAPTCAASGGLAGGRRSRPCTLARGRAGGLQHLVGPQVVRIARRRRQGVAAALVGPVEVLTGLPRGVGLLAGPPGVDEVLVGALQRSEQFEPLEPRSALDGAGATLEPLLEPRLLVLRNADGIDLHDAHDPSPSRRGRRSIPA